MNSLIVNQLKSIDLFSETMINYLVYQYLDNYTVTLEFDTKSKHNSYKFTLDKFLSTVSKAPKCLKQPVLYNGNCYCGTGIYNLKVSFYENCNKYLFSIDHLNLVPDALKSLQKISEDELVNYDLSFYMKRVSIAIANPTIQEEVFNHDNDNNEIYLQYNRY